LNARVDMHAGQRIAAAFERHYQRARREFPECSDCEQRLIAIGCTEDQYGGPATVDEQRARERFYIARAELNAAIARRIAG
jgi:hypothetical protein